MTELCKSYDKAFGICKNASCKQRKNPAVTCPVKDDGKQWNP